MTTNITKLPWVQELGEGFIPVEPSDFEEMRAWAMRIRSECLILVEQTNWLNKELRIAMEKNKEQYNLGFYDGAIAICALLGAAFITYALMLN